MDVGSKVVSELGDDELKTVNGGAGVNPTKQYSCPKCGPLKLADVMNKNGVAVCSFCKEAVLELNVKINMNFI